MAQAYCEWPLKSKLGNMGVSVSLAEKSRCHAVKHEITSPTTSPSLADEASSFKQPSICDSAGLSATAARSV